MTVSQFLLFAEVCFLVWTRQFVQLGGYFNYRDDSPVRADVYDFDERLGDFLRRQPNHQRLGGRFTVNDCLVARSCVSAPHLDADVRLNHPCDVKRGLEEDAFPNKGSEVMWQMGLKPVACVNDQPGVDVAPGLLQIWI
ncbi:MAG TPA: hypothetical protein VFA18_19350, partial [Gemmataceae bacterium]|nr:hypothetical protein [Gemmataceae bacterium]